MGIAKRLFLDRSPAPRGNVHPIPTDANYPEGAANLYADELQTFYGADKLDPARPLFDLVLMGSAPTAMSRRSIRNRARWTKRSVGCSASPRPDGSRSCRVHTDVSTLASCREMLFLVDGAEKRDILHRVFSGEDLPGACVYCNADLVWLLDRAAAPERVS